MSPFHLLEFFKGEHMVYAGTGPEKKGFKKTVVIYENIVYDHIHMLDLDFPVEKTGIRSKMVLDAKIYPYIRRGNVAGIFGGKKPGVGKKKKPKIKIRIADP